MTQTFRKTPKALRESTGAQLADAERTLNQPHLDAARSRLGDATWEELLAEGRSMTLERAMAYALGGRDGARSARVAEERG